jgi:hypothetical protein
MDTTDGYQYLRIGDLDRVLLSFCAQSVALNVRRRGKVVGSIEVAMSPDRLVLKYTTRRGEKIADPVSIEYSPCHFGGRRPWFICPDCEKRKTVLFRARYFRCATCLGLTYATLNESKADRPFNRLIRLRRKLGGSESIYDPFPPKPKGMGRKKYATLDEQYQRNFLAYTAETTKTLAVFERRVSSVSGTFEKRSKLDATTPKDPNRATAPHALSPENFALAARFMAEMRKAKPPSGS